MKILTGAGFPFPLPPGHRFPLRKHALLQEAVAASGLVLPEDLIGAEPATNAQVLYAHDRDYLERVLDGQLSRKEIQPDGADCGRDGAKLEPASAKPEARAYGKH